MSHQVLARKWRPQTFADIVGQDHVVKALVNALKADRLHHAYLFSGTRGVGKTTIARILAKALTCEKGISAEPCGSCAICEAITQGRFVDLIEVDAASKTGVDDTRELLENVQYAPALGRFKIYLIDEVHMLSGHSFNALLKTLEEPPEYVKFLLATTVPQKLPITVLSRCLQFTLRQISAENICAQLQLITDTEKLPSEPNALMQLADAADGSMRDALSMLDQAIAFSDGDLNEQAINQMLGAVPSEKIDALVAAICDFDAASAIKIMQELASLNVDFAKLNDQLATIFHAAALAQAVPDYLQHVALFAKTVEKIAQQIAAQDLQLFYQIAINCRKDLYLASSPRAGFEMAVLRMIMFRPLGEGKAPVARRVRSAPAGKPQQNTEIPASKSPAVSASIIEPSIDSAPTAASEPPVQVVESSEQNSWAAIITKMNLTGVSLALANHCELLGQDDSKIKLGIATDHESLRTEDAVKNVTAALQHQFGDAVDVSIDISNQRVGSPAQLEKDHQDVKMQQAESSLQEDSFIRALQTDLQAEIIPGSVKPTTTQPIEK